MKLEQLILKVASRCNINCSYCYMYNLGDDSWKSQPKVVSEETVIAVRKRIQEYCKEHGLTQFHIIFHGGEPLLLGKEYFVRVVQLLQEDTDIDTRISMQTNGILIDDEWCDIFKKCKVGVGVSIDGTREINDLYRVDKQGRGTFDRITAGINCLKKNGITYGTLSVLNPEIPPATLYQALKEYASPYSDVILRDFNYDTITAFPYTDYFTDLFDLWYNDTSGSPIRFRLFELIMRAILGENIDIDCLGTSVKSALIIETNGGIEAVDVLKSCGKNFTKNSLSIHHNALDEALSDDLIEIFYNSGTYLPKQCVACPVKDICGGGYLPHRYSSANGFNNPTVYCTLLLKLITHIQNRLFDKMPAGLNAETGLERLTFSTAEEILRNQMLVTPEPDYTYKLERFGKARRAALQEQD